MDSCHIFNFLFGTRKATTELSKCFASTLNSNSGRNSSNSKTEPTFKSGTTKSRIATRIADRIKSTWQSASSASEESPEVNQKLKLSSSAPSTPLKQLQMRINATFAPQEDASESKQASGNHLLDDDEDDFEVDDKDNEENDTLISEAHCRMRSSSACGRCDTETKVCGTFRAKLVESFNDEDTGASNQVGWQASAAKQVVLYDDSIDLPEGDCNNGTDVSIRPVLAEVYEIGSSAKTDENQAKPRTQLMRRLSPVPSLDQSEGSFEDCNQKEEPTIVTRANVKNLVQSFESSTLAPETNDSDWPTCKRRTANEISYSCPSTATQVKRPKPITIVKPMPPKTPPKTNKVKCLNHQLALHKPARVEHLFRDDEFLAKFFTHLEPLDRCVAAQVCKQWRRVLYSDQNYWKNLVGVIDCTHLRREHLVECILNTLQTAKLKYQRSLESDHRTPTNQLQLNRPPGKTNGNNTSAIIRSNGNKFLPSEVMQSYNYIGRNNSEMLDQFNLNETDYIHQEDVWRIQELCNRFSTSRVSQHQQSTNNSTQSWSSSRQQTCSSINVTSTDAFTNENNETNNHTSGQQAPKSASIPSQISSTLSSVSLSSLLSPLSESSRVDLIREKLYLSFDDRGFDSICLFGATDDDIDDLISKTSQDTHQRISAARLNNCCVTDRGLELFFVTFDQIQELELSGCNEISNSLDLRALNNLRKLEISDCINIADGVAQKLLPIFHLLYAFVIQSYHLTDAFFEYLCINTKTAQLRHLELPNCKEISNQSLFTISKHFTQLEVLSVSGSTKITDDGIEILAEQAKCLKSLNLSWCNKITNAALECIACDLGSTLTDLILDR